MKKYFVFIILIFLFAFSSVLLTGCDLDSLYINNFSNDNNDNEEKETTKYKVTVTYLDSKEELEYKQGDVVTIKSVSSDFGSWMIDGVTVSYDKEFKFTVNKDETIYEMAKDDAEKDFCFYSYVYKKDGKLNLYCKYYNPSNLEVTKVGFLVSNDKNNLDKQIYNWSDLSELVASSNEYNEFTVSYNSDSFVFASFVETKNGENISVYHYSKISSYGN